MKNPHTPITVIMIRNFSICLFPLFMVSLVLNCGMKDESGIVAFFDEYEEANQIESWRVLAFENRTLAFGRLGIGIRSRGRRLSRYLVQMERASSIRIPMETSRGRRIVTRLHYDDKAKGSVTIRFLSEGIVVTEKKLPLGDPVVSFRTGLTKNTGADEVEIVHRAKPGSVIPLNAVACGDVPITAAEPVLRGLTAILDWLCKSGFDARGGLPKSSVFPVSLDRCTRRGHILLPTEHFQTRMPRIGRGDHLRTWVTSLSNGPFRDCAVEFEVKSGDSWFTIKVEQPKEKNRWSTVAVTLPDSLGTLDSLRCRNQSKNHVIVVAEPHILLKDRRHRKLNLIIIDLDTARADRFGAYGYTERPTTARLDSFLHEKGFSVFQNSYAPSPWTLASTAKFFASRYTHYEMRNSTSNITEDMPLLAEILRSNDYYCVAYTGGVVLRTPGFERGFHEYYWSRKSGKIEDSFPQAMKWLKGSVDPFFLFLHTYETHGPYIRPVFCSDLPRGRIIDPALRRGTGLEKDAEISSAESLYIEALYDGGIRTATDAVADLFEQMDSQGLWENTVVVILSDHGEEFWEHFHVFQEHGHSLYGEILNVPFMIYYPDGGSYRDIKEPVSLVDLVPTVADLLNLTWNGEADGENLVPLMEGNEFERKLPILANLSNNRPWEIRCIIHDGYKYLESWRKADTENIPIRHGIDYPSGREIYALRTDPEELENLASENQELVSLLVDSLNNAYYRINPPMKSDNQKTRGGMGGVLQQQLEALGYVTDEE